MKKNIWSILIEASPEGVWEALTRADVPQPFYFGTALRGKLEVGASYRYESMDGRLTFIEGRVLSIDPPRRLVHTFRFADIDEPHGTVTYELEPEAGGTRLTIVHVGLGPKHLKRVTGGWPTLLGRIKAWLETGRLPFMARVPDAAFRLVQPLLPSSHKGVS